jgi:hypothetical protein
VAVELDPSRYLVALEAHAKGEYVVATGMLKRIAAGISMMSKFLIGLGPDVSMRPPPLK